MPSSLSRHPHGEAPLCLCSELTVLSCLEIYSMARDHYSLWLVKFSSDFLSLFWHFSYCKKIAEPTGLFVWHLLVCTADQPTP